jgi:hypothetical protein
MRRRGLHGAKAAYQRQQAEAAERARHRSLVAADLELDAIEELHGEMWDAPSPSPPRHRDWVGAECLRLRHDLDALLAGGRRG